MTPADEARALIADHRRKLDFALTSTTLCTTQFRVSDMLRTLHVWETNLRRDAGWARQALGALGPNGMGPAVDGEYRAALARVPMLEAAE